MGALSGPITANAYYVRGDLPKTFREDVVAGLYKHKFQEINLDLDREESIGWVNTADVTDAVFDTSKVFWGDYILATIRHDSVRIPASTFKVKLRKEIADYCQKNGKAKLSKSEKDDIRDTLEKRMKRAAIPSIRTFDVVWNFERGLVWFFGTNRKANESFCDIFEESFCLQVHEKCPYSSMEAAGISDSILECAIGLDAASFILPASRGRVSSG